VSVVFVQELLLALRYAVAIEQSMVAETKPAQPIANKRS
jgi:hypothetical protein